MTFRPFLPPGIAVLVAMQPVPAMAQAPHHGAGQTVREGAPSRAQPGKAKPAKARATGAAHQKACRNRYKSYDARRDSYLHRGKRVRCTL